MRNPNGMSNWELFGIGAAVGGVAGLGLLLFTYWGVTQILAEVPQPQQLPTPQPVPSSTVTSPTQSTILPNG